VYVSEGDDDRVWEVLGGYRAVQRHQVHHRNVGKGAGSDFDWLFCENLKYIVAIGNPERHVRKASHRGSKQQ